MKQLIVGISYALYYTRLEKLAGDKHSSLFDPFISFVTSSLCLISMVSAD